MLLIMFFPVLMPILPSHYGPPAVRARTGSYAIHEYQRRRVVRVKDHPCTRPIFFEFFTSCGHAFRA